MQIRPKKLSAFLLQANVEKSRFYQMHRLLTESVVDKHAASVTAGTSGTTQMVYG